MLLSLLSVNWFKFRQSVILSENIYPFCRRDLAKLLRGHAIGCALSQSRIHVSVHVRTYPVESFQCSVAFLWIWNPCRLSLTEGMADSFAQINSKISSLFVEIQRPIVQQSNELFVPGTHGNFSRISLCLLRGADISLSAKWIRPNFHTNKIDFWKYCFTCVLLLHLSLQNCINELTPSLKYVPKSGILNNYRDQLSSNF